MNSLLGLRHKISFSIWELIILSFLLFLLISSSFVLWLVLLLIFSEPWHGEHVVLLLLLILLLLHLLLFLLMLLLHKVDRLAKVFRIFATNILSMVTGARVPWSLLESSWVVCRWKAIVLMLRLLIRVWQKWWLLINMCTCSAIWNPCFCNWLLRRCWCIMVSLRWVLENLILLLLIGTKSVRWITARLVIEQASWSASIVRLYLRKRENNLLLRTWLRMLLL